MDAIFRKTLKIHSQAFQYTPAAPRFTNILNQLNTPEREVDVEREKLADSILKVGKMPTVAGESAVKALYNYMGLPVPDILWYDSPYQLRKSKPLTDKDHAPQSMVFRHLTGYTVTSRRDQWGHAGNQENWLRRVVRLIERDSGVEDGWTGDKETRYRDFSLASLKFGPQWYSARTRRESTETSEWAAIDPLMENIAQTTTGFIFTAGTAHLVRRPTKLELDDTTHLLNSETGHAIEWKDGRGVYALKGVWFDKDSYEAIVNKTMDTEQALGLVDVDQRRVAISYLHPADMIKAMKSELVNEGVKRSYKYIGRRIERVGAPTAKKVLGKLKKSEPTDITVSNKLYRTLFFRDPRGPIMFWGRSSLQPSDDDWRYFLHYNDPSTGEDYISFCTEGVNERGKDADAVMAWKHHMTKEDYLTMYLEA